MYGSAIWNHWLERSYGADAVRARLGAQSQPQDHFAPGAYDVAISTGRKSFAQEFAEFAASTAAWDGPGSGIHDGDPFPGRGRAGPVELDARARMSAPSSSTTPRSRLHDIHRGPRRPPPLRLTRHR